MDLLSSGLGGIELRGVIKSYRDNTDSSAELSLAQLEDVPLDTLSEEVEIQGTEWKYSGKRNKGKENAHESGGKLGQ